MEREGIRTQGILEQIVQTGEPVILTNVSEGVATPGTLKGTVLEEVDIVSHWVLMFGMFARYGEWMALYTSRMGRCFSRAMRAQSSYSGETRRLPPIVAILTRTGPKGVWRVSECRSSRWR